MITMKKRMMIINIQFIKLNSKLHNLKFGCLSKQENKAPERITERIKK